MIKIDTITIKNFRGIRDLKLKLNGESFAACGRNGTGKSGIVDAIEFALTGKISRLMGRGTGELSVKEHGPHVDFSKKPELASVTLEVSLPGTTKKGSITRTVKAASSPTITPVDPDIKAAFESARLHPEFVLSRRELIKYIIAEPTSRSEEVQALLRLDDIGKLRTVLNKIANATNKDVGPCERATAAAKSELMSALGISEFTATAILTAANAARATLNLAPLSALESTTALNDGLATAESEGTDRVAKIQALADVAVMKAALAKFTGEQFGKQCGDALTAAEDLNKDAAAIDSVTREAILTSALQLFDDQACPVCDTAFEAAAFREIVNGKLSHLATVGQKRKALDALVSPVLADIVSLGTALGTVIAYGARMSPVVDTSALVAFKAALQGRYQTLNKLLPLSASIEVLSGAQTVPNLEAAISAVDAAIGALPEASKQTAAHDMLTIAQDRLVRWRTARADQAIAQAQAEKAAVALKTFTDVTDGALEEIYSNVEATFSTLYREINREDEETFTAKLLPSIGKLGFGVDFYGRGRFPPGAYHSEGHQDGMGLCLYLALMSHLQGENFKLAVLDDVLMSVDAGHRREVCTVLKKHFPHTQFVFTTHDEIWLRHMKSEGLIKGKNATHFRTWTVDLGPKEWDDNDVWADIEAFLEKENVQGAAALLRHYLEHFAREACHRLRAKVEFRSDAQFTLGELMPNAVAGMKAGFKMAKASANSWNKKEDVEAIGARDTAFTAALTKTKFEDWQINAAVHFNEWDTLQKADFAPVVEAFKALIGHFICATPECQETYYVTPDRGPKKEALRCGCGATNLNLIEK